MSALDLFNKRDEQIDPFVLVFLIITALMVALVIVAGISYKDPNEETKELCRQNKGKLIYVGYSNSYNCEMP